MANFVTVDKFLNVNSASLAKSVLEGSGIQCWLSDENLTVMAPHYGFFAGGIKLQVVPEDLERAQEILDNIALDPEDESAADEPVEEAPLPPAPDGKETLRVLQTGMEAAMLRDFLKAQGFAAAVQSPKTGRLYGGNMAGGYMVNVPRKEADAARTLLDDVETEDELPAGLEAYEDEADAELAAEPELCPNCGATNIVMGEAPRWLRLLGIVLLLGLPLLFSTRNVWTCRDCGWEWTP